jgi:hypothetical protein
MTARWHSRGVIVSGLLVVVAAVGAGAWASNGHDGGAGSPGTTTSNPAHSTSTSSTKLSAPRDTAVQDGRYLADVTEADPALVTYEKSDGNVALRSLLTDGSAFCAFLQRDGDIDGAMVSVAEGAQQDESETHLPLSVTTFNAVDAVALLTLCPSLEKVVPASDMVKIRALGATLSGTPPSP